jgi:uncharacterized membrane protein YjgN (DUF898 family)
MDQTTQPQSNASALPFQFTGKGGEYFKIWIVNLVLSILTLGIYSAWAKVRTQRYFYGNTQVDNTGFEYHANPVAILKGRLIAIAVLLVYVVIGQLFPFAAIAFAVVLTLATPWIVWRGIQFNARMTSYRNVRFGFYGSLKESYLYLLLIPLIPLLIAAGIAAVMWFTSGTMDPKALFPLVTLAVLATYLIFPYVQKIITSYFINNHRYGQGQMNATLSAKKYYFTYLCLIGWTLVIFAALGFAGFMAVKFVGINLATLAPAMNGEVSPVAMAPFIGVIIFLYLAMFMIGIWFKAYVNTKIRNHVYGNVRLDNVLQLESNMSVGKLFRFYLVNVLLLICTLGLAYPWIKVRIARITADATQAQLNGNLDQFINQQQNNQTALGEEKGEAFDVTADMDLAF